MSKNIDKEVFVKLVQSLNIGQYETEYVNANTVTKAREQYNDMVELGIIDTDKV